jgi:hypothetical protein
MEPQHIPLAIRILAGVALLFALNEMAPGVAPSVLILVALYLILSQSAIVGSIVTGTTASLNRTIGPRALVGNFGRNAPMPRT